MPFIVTTDGVLLNTAFVQRFEWQPKTRIWGALSSDHWYTISAEVLRDHFDKNEAIPRALAEALADKDGDEESDETGVEVR